MFIIGDFRPGPLSREQAEMLNRLAEQVERLSRQDFVSPLYVNEGPAGQSVSVRLPDPEFPAQITAYQSGAYSWTEVLEGPSGSFVAKVGARSGDATTSPLTCPAWEAEGSATVPINSYVYLRPGFLDTAVPGTGQNYLFEFPASAGSGVTHNLLSLTHADTLPANVVKGDLVIGGSGPLWKRLGGNITYVRQFLISLGAGGIAVEPVWGALILADIPAHNLLSLTHADTLPDNVQVGDVVVGGSGPLWKRLPANATSIRKFLMSVNGLPPSWVALVLPDFPGHNLLSATHPDTNAAAVVEGDIVIGVAGPAWERLPGPIEITQKVLISQGDGVKALAPFWGAPTVGMHNLLSATHPDTNAGTVVAGDLIAGAAGPAWERLVGNITTARQFLVSQGTGAAAAKPFWAALAVGDVPGHNLLSATHPDTAAYSPPLVADLICGQDSGGGVIKWTKLSAPTTPSSSRFYLTEQPSGGAANVPQWRQPDYNDLINTPAPFGTFVPTVRGFGTSYASGTVLTITGVTVPYGEILIIASVMLSGSSSSPPTVKWNGNTCVNFTNTSQPTNSNMTANLCWYTGDGSTGPLVVTWPQSGTAFATVAVSVAGLVLNDADQGWNTQNAGSTAVDGGTNTTPAIGREFFGSFIFIKGPSADGAPAWTNGYTVGNSSAIVGTNSGAANTNVSIMWGYLNVANGRSAALTVFSPKATLNVSRPWICTFGALK